MYFVFLFLILISQPSLAVINGKEFLNKLDVVRLTFSNGWVCSGVYIDNQTVLTAAHCIAADEPIQLEKVESDNDEVLKVEQTMLIPHPDFKHQYWPSRDIGIVKTTENQKFAKNFVIETNPKSSSGKAYMFGCGSGRLVGENTFFEISGVQIFIGSKVKASVAPHDSGGPIIDEMTGKIVGVMTTTTQKRSLSLGLPIISTATSVVDEPNLRFIQEHMEK